MSIKTSIYFSYNTVATNETPTKAPTTKVFFQCLIPSMLLIEEAAFEDDDEEDSVDFEALDSSDDLVVLDLEDPDDPAAAAVADE